MGRWKHSPGWRNPPCDAWDGNSQAMLNGLLQYTMGIQTLNLIKALINISISSFQTNNLFTNNFARERRVSYHGWEWQSHYQWVLRWGQIVTASCRWQYWHLSLLSTDTPGHELCTQLGRERKNIYSCQYYDRLTARAQSNLDQRNNICI